MGFLKKWEVSPPSSGLYANDQWINPDLAPVTSERRTWGPGHYVLYWITGGFAIYVYSTGSALIAYGLSGTQCLAAGIVSPIILAAMCVLCGWPGGSHNITYTVASRMSWGMRGSWFAVFIRVMPGLIWDGIEAYWGGQAVATLIGTLSLRWANWEGPPLADVTLQLKDLIGFIIYYVIFLIVMWLPPERLFKPFLVSCTMFIIFVFALLIWAVNAAGGAGPYFAADYQAPALLAGSTGWAAVYGATSAVGNCAVITLGQSDWCRFSRGGNKAPMIAQVIACPIFIYLAFALGIVVTSASAKVLGEPIWQPYLLLRELQAHYGHSASARAAVFFASAACTFSQVTVNIVLNSVASAMDMASYAPRWLNIRRGAYIIAAIGFAVNPWQITSSAASFITALQGFGIFYGPCSGILAADFWVVRKRHVQMRDLYLGNASGVYWFKHGVNFRAVVAFVLAITPSFPGYIIGCLDLERSPNGWMKLSRLGFITGFLIASGAYIGLSFFFPPAAAGTGEDRFYEGTLILPSAYDQTRPTQKAGSDVLVGLDVSDAEAATVDQSKGSKAEKY